MINRIGQRFGDYRLIRFLGEGTFGDVYFGEQVYEKSPAAVKVFKAKLTPDKFKGFINEFRTILLNHPNIVQVLDFGIGEDDIPFLVMEYAPNGTLLQRHPRGICLPLPTVITYVKEIAAALQYAHDQRRIHRDVKPENILFGAHNEILLSDFGIAAIQKAYGVYAFDAKTGTPLWRAPTGDFIESSLAVADGVVYAAAHDGKLYAFDAKKGTSQWTTPTGSNLFSSPAMVNGVIYDTSVGGDLYAFDAKTGGILWTTSTGGSIFSSPTVANGVIYVGSWSDHKLYAFKAKTGAIVWTYPTGGSIFSSPMVANGVLYVGSEDFKLDAFHLA